MAQSKRQTLEQLRAAAAWEHVDKGVNEAAKSKYGTLARKLPAMIQINGLASTLAFLKAKGKDKSEDGHTLVYQHLSAWVIEYLNLEKDLKTLLDRIQQKKKWELLDFARNAAMDEYRRATTEAVEYGIWLKRYVEAKDWGSAQGDDS